MKLGCSTVPTECTCACYRCTRMLKPTQMEASWHLHSELQMCQLQHIYTYITFTTEWYTFDANNRNKHRSYGGLLFIKGTLVFLFSAQRIISCTPVSISKSQTEKSRSMLHLIFKLLSKNLANWKFALCAGLYWLYMFSVRSKCQKPTFTTIWMWFLSKSRNFAAPKYYTRTIRNENWPTNCANSAWYGVSLNEMKHKFLPVHRHRLYRV